MLRQDFNYELPEHLIAQFPVYPRHTARLLAYSRAQDSIQHHTQVLDIVDYFQAGDLLISNDTKVLPARFYAQKTSGGKVEVLMERMLSETTMLCHIRSSKSPKAGAEILVNEQWSLKVLGREHDLFHVEANGSIVKMLNEVGHMPLPPYIQRADEESDKTSYQTIFAKHEGSVAAPTAGLHFDEVLLKKLQDKQVDMASVTLHVGAGTFQPVRVDAIKDHVMHYEWYEVSPELLAKIKKTKAYGNRVIAVGTTSLRALESAARNDFAKLSGLTNLFITPGYEFQVIDGLMTNFHLPESTLLMLVSALIGHEPLMRVYQEAVSLSYRFFSYGDACLFI
ncbi:MAG TPA: tRNA preQ1(34) S-adenosylmethionine ribosyltransferase-isomerase QueA [Legionellales bacterium]|nr:tRNA preQ1(34) S-adenosylmethionine ribosyltransferase-isomerase QueA [Legionellales bacterium]